MSGATIATKTAAASAITAATITSRRGRFLVTTPISLAKFDEAAHPAWLVVATLLRHASPSVPAGAAQRRRREPPRMARRGPRRARRDGQRRRHSAVDTRAFAVHGARRRAVVRANSDDPGGRPPGGVRRDRGGRRRAARVDRRTGPSCRPGDRRARLHGRPAGAAPA